MEPTGFDLAPPGAIWYQQMQCCTNYSQVLISLPPELSGILVAVLCDVERSFDLAPPGAIWYHLDWLRRTAERVLISLPPELSGIMTGTPSSNADVF